MAPTTSTRIVACSAWAIATATAIVLWGVGAEAVHYRDYLKGGLMLADALVVTLLEGVTAWQYVEWRSNRYSAIPRCWPLPQPLRAVDTYRRAAVYVVLTVPCFVHASHWLPIVPGVMLIASAVAYAVKHICFLRSQRTIVKVPTFVRFKDESASAETQSPAPAADQEAQGAAKLSHQSSFASSHSSGCSVQMGSKDSGIEASQRDAAAAAAAGAPAGPDEAKGRKQQRGLVRAYSSSPDRCCLISEDNLSLRD